MNRAVALAVGGLVMFFAFMIFLGAVLPSPDQLGSQTLALPGVVCAPPGAAPGSAVAGFKGDQLANAALIVAAGAEMGVPQHGQVIAVATAMQESGLHNLNHGDRDSLGLFQQRTNWGSVQTREDPKASAKLFYAHLLAIPGWQGLPLTVAAQKVQASALPDAYARWEAPALQIVGSALGIACQPAGPAAPGAPGSAPAPNLPPVSDPTVRLVIARVTAQLGKPYAWGGGNAAGPTHGTPGGGAQAARFGDVNKVGFDCSGLMVYAFAGVGIVVPHQTQAIWATFRPPITNRAQFQPGDMVLASSNGQPSGIDHVGLYIGNGQVIDAPESGKNVQIEQNINTNPWWASHVIGAVRPLATKGAQPLA